MNVEQLIALAREANVPPVFILVALLVGAAAALLARTWQQRRKSTEALVTRQAELLTADGADFRKALMKMVFEQDQKIARMTTKLGECQRLHANCEGEVRVLRSEVARLESEVTQLQQQIARLDRRQA